MFAKAKILLRSGEFVEYDVKSGRVDSIVVDELGISIFKGNCVRTYPFSWMQHFDLTD